MRHLASTLRGHLENILTHLTHRITNAVTVGLNAKIQMDQVFVSWKPRDECEVTDNWRLIWKSSVISTSGGIKSIVTARVGTRTVM